MTTFIPYYFERDLALRFTKGGSEVYAPNFKPKKGTKTA